MIIRKDEIMKMLALQKEMNDRTNGISWVHGITKEKRSINWPRCIYGEAFELMDSYPWKHWKGLNDPADMANARKELTDIWHFLLSYGIHSHFMFSLFVTKKDLLGMASKKESSPDFMEVNSVFNEDSYRNLIELSGYKTLLETGTVIDKDEYNKFYCTCVESLLTDKIDRALSVSNLDKSVDIYAELDFLNMIATKAAVFERVVPEEGTEYMHYSTKVQMFDSMIAVFNRLLKNFLPMELSREYLGKNALNKFRQDNGYKEGTYIKIWSGEEDNVHLDTILANFEKDEPISFEEIYAHLEIRYKEFA